jgi:hypothetical protein
VAQQGQRLISNQTILKLLGGSNHHSLARLLEPIDQHDASRRFEGMAQAVIAGNAIHWPAFKTL